MPGSVRHAQDLTLEQADEGTGLGNSCARRRVRLLVHQLRDRESPTWGGYEAERLGVASQPQGDRRASLRTLGLAETWRRGNVSKWKGRVFWAEGRACAKARR